MIGTVLRVNWLQLRRDYGSLALAFVLPIAFFSLLSITFGSIGGGGDDGGLKPIRVLAVDLDRTETSRRFLDALADQEALRVVVAPEPTDEVPEPAPFALDDARLRVRRGEAPVAVVLPEGFGATLGDWGGDGVPVELLYDAADPIARHTVAGLIQATVMTAVPDVLMRRGVEMLETYGGPLTPEQRQAVEQGLPSVSADSTIASDGAGTTGEGGLAEGAPAGSAGAGGIGLVPITAVDVRDDDAEETGKQRSIVAYQAAGIGVMFLLFSMVGAGGALLDEEESGVLERVLSSRLSMTGLLAGKWLFFALFGATQVALMFVWGAVFFGVDLWRPERLAGFAVMTLATAAAASGFGLVFATACRSRAQLGSTSTLVILGMSAVGGSMVPRFLMPEFMNTAALFTLNGWALDGFLKVFWYGDPDAGVGATLASIAPQVAVLVLMAAVFLGLARMLARRWETA